MQGVLVHTMGTIHPTSACPHPSTSKRLCRIIPTIWNLALNITICGPATASQMNELER